MFANKRQGFFEKRAAVVHAKYGILQITNYISSLLQRNVVTTIHLFDNLWFNYINMEMKWTLSYDTQDGVVTILLVDDTTETSSVLCDG